MANKAFPPGARVKATRRLSARSPAPIQGRRTPAGCGLRVAVSDTWDWCGPGRAEVIPLCPMREVVGRWHWHGVAVSTAMTLWLLFVIRACLGMDLASWRCAEREGDDEAGISGLAGGVALTRES